MRLLFTADWQAEWENLDLCDQAAALTMDIARMYDVEGIIIAGDLKRQYNPVDVRVTRFWMDAISQMVKRKHRVIVVLGNHDRVGLHSEAQNWLPILAKAGAEVYDTPHVVRFGREDRLWVLPFAPAEEMKKGLATLLRQRRDPIKETDALVFHGDLNTARYNMLGHRSDASMKASDLQPELFAACIGGHIHKPQKIGSNIYYVGSPFSTDWGEANQTKRFLVFRSGKVGSVPSEIPGWYDPTWPGFKEPRPGPGLETWEGTRIRIHVKVRAGGNYGDLLETARCRAEQEYPKARIYTVTDFVGGERGDIQVSPTASDVDKIRAYVEQSVPDHLERQKEKMIAFLAYRLSEVGTVMRASDSVEFDRVAGRNFLSFKNTECDLKAGGLVLITGKNMDWQGRSNGAGKTNLLQMLPVALFGSTFKGQKYDRWTRRSGEGPSSVVAQFWDSQGRKVEVTRKRRPGVLSLKINGEDMSSGYQGKGGTQAAIESLCGFTWQTLANAVFIDQTETDFLVSSPKERKEILDQFQNLERFTKAGELVKKDRASNDKAFTEVNEQIIEIRGERKALAQLRGKEGRAEVLVEQVARVRQEKEELSDALESVRRRRDKESKRVLHYRDDIGGVRVRVKWARMRLRECEDGIQQATDIKEKTQCPTCWQEVDRKTIAGKMKDWTVQKTELDTELGHLRADLDQAEHLFSECRSKEQELERKANDLTGMMSGLASILASARRELTHQKKLGRQLSELQVRLQAFEAVAWQMKDKYELLVYCQSALSRDGVPAFLSKQILPVLNQAAEYYSELFTSKEIQVRFEIEEGNFRLLILNARGGDGLEDQSTGERRMAGLITSFSLRSIAPKSNILILDEPGGGLDAANARAFATGLRKLQKGFGTVFLTTHHPAIVSELEDAKLWTVEKRDGVSRLIARE